MPEIRLAPPGPYLGPLDAFTFYPAPPPPLGFHQLVLSGRYGVAVSSNGTYDVQWRGSQTGGITVITPPVVQDTDGYSGTAGDMQFGGPTITTWTIPAGRAGDYEVGWEQAPIIVGNDPWWDYINGRPKQVPYVYYGYGDGCGAEIRNGTATITWNLLVNGVVVASSFVQATGSGLHYWAPYSNKPATIITGLQVGNTLKMQIVFTGGNTFSAMYASYGIVVYGVQQGFFIMRQVA